MRTIANHLGRIGYLWRRVREAREREGGKIGAMGVVWCAETVAAMKALEDALDDIFDKEGYPIMDKKGCGGAATRIVFRGPTKRLYLCADCPYEGKGSIKPYETGEYDPKTAQPGRFTGPAKMCGEETE